MVQMYHGNNVISRLRGPPPREHFPTLSHGMFGIENIFTSPDTKVI